MSLASAILVRGTFFPILDLSFPTVFTQFYTGTLVIVAVSPTGLRDVPALHPFRCDLPLSSGVRSARGFLPILPALVWEALIYAQRWACKIAPDSSLAALFLHQTFSSFSESVFFWLAKMQTSEGNSTPSALTR